MKKTTKKKLMKNKFEEISAKIAVDIANMQKHKFDLC